MFLIGCGQSFEEIDSVEDIYGEYTTQKVRALIVENDSFSLYTEEGEDSEELFEQPKKVTFNKTSFPAYDGSDIIYLPAEYSISEEGYVNVELTNINKHKKTMKLYKIDGNYYLDFGKNRVKVDGEIKKVMYAQEYIPE
jgi:hypothetical protein